jgi:hypothetical protein
MPERMSKELCQLWLEKGFKLNGKWSVRKPYKKSYPAYMDNHGIEHAAQTREFAFEITFNPEDKNFTLKNGAIIDGVFVEIKEDHFTIGLETLRLICKTVKELGWN